MREIMFMQVDRIDACVVDGLVPMLTLTIVERVGKQVVETVVHLQFNDVPGTDELPHDLAEGINAIMSIHKPLPEAAVLPFKRREPA